MANISERSLLCVESLYIHLRHHVYESFVYDLWTNTKETGFVPAFIHKRQSMRQVCTCPGKASTFTKILLKSSRRTRSIQNVWERDKSTYRSWSCLFRMFYDVWEDAGVAHKHTYLNELKETSCLYNDSKVTYSEVTRSPDGFPKFSIITIFLHKHRLHHH